MQLAKHQPGMHEEIQKGKRSDNNSNSKEKTVHWDAYPSYGFSKNIYHKNASYLCAEITTNDTTAYWAYEMTKKLWKTMDEKTEFDKEKRKT